MEFDLAYSKQYESQALYSLRFFLKSPERQNARTRGQVRFFVAKCSSKPRIPLNMDQTCPGNRDTIFVAGELPVRRESGSIPVVIRPSKR